MEKHKESPFYHWIIDAEALRMLIRRRGFTPHSLAMRTGVNKRVIYRLVSGERSGATFPTIEALAQALDIDIHVFADPSLRFETRMLRSG